jgi:hypothetical protein
LSALAVYQELLRVNPNGKQIFDCPPVDINITVEAVKVLDQVT